MRNIDSLFLLKAPGPSVDRCRPINLTVEARQYPSFPLGLGSERFGDVLGGHNGRVNGSGQVVAQTEHQLFASTAGRLP